MESFKRGVAIPAHPLALTASRKLDEQRQRALTRYYLAAGVGGLAVGVHTTQFAIRDPKIGLFEPVLSLAKEEMDRAGRDVFRIGGVCGETKQAIAEATLLKTLGYDAGLLSLAALKNTDDDTLLAHCRTVGEIIPLVGFYLQPAVGGRVLPYAFWRRFFEIESVIAVKIAPFNRYQTLDVIRALAEAGRQDIALYTGNDDAIVTDLVTTYFGRRIVGGLLGHWACWTKSAVGLLKTCQAITDTVPTTLLDTGIAETDRNAALFDAANGFHGCIAGIHYVLQQQGLLEGIWCLDENEGLSPGQRKEIDRVHAAYPQLAQPDENFIAEHLDDWLR